MAAFTIPNTSLAVGAHTFGPLAATNFQAATITVDRTVTGGLNSLTPTSVLDARLEWSPDGTTWNPLTEAATTGGTILDVRGQPRTTWSLGYNSSGVPGTQTRAVITVGGPSNIEVAGSLTTA